MINYEEFKRTDFYQFFNLSEALRRNLEFGDIQVNLNPGAHKAHITIILILDPSSQIKKAKLVLNRAWIGDQRSINPLSTDISKSFIATLFPYPENETLKLLLHYLFNLRGEKDWFTSCQRKCLSPLEESVGDEIKHFLEIFRGLEDNCTIKIHNHKLNINHLGSKKDSLLIECIF